MLDSIPQKPIQCTFNFDVLNVQPAEDLTFQAHQIFAPLQKRCNKCEKTKELDQFHKGHNTCKVCRKADSHERYLRIKNTPVGELQFHDEYKTCAGPCERILPASLEFFHRNKAQKSGLNPRCKECMKAYRSQPEVKERHRQQERMRYQKPEVKEHARNYRQRPEVREKRREYKRRPEVREKDRAYRQRPEVRKRSRMHSLARYYRPEVKEHMQEYHRAYMHRPEVRIRENEQKRTHYQNPEVRDRILARHRARYHRPEVKERTLAKRREYEKQPEVRERILVQKRLYYRRDGVRERANTQRRLAYQNNPEARSRRILGNMKREVRKKSIPGTLIPSQIQYKLRKQKFRCYYCFAKFEKKGKNHIYHIEHTVPISRLEANPRHDMSYVVLACPSCNCKKGDKLPHEFLEGGRLL